MDKVCKRGHIRTSENIWKDGNCKRCREVRWIESFNKTSFCPSGHLRTQETVYKNGGCKACAKDYLNRPDVKVKHAKRTRNYHIKQAFGLTEEQYNSLFIQQNGQCFLCGDHQSILTKKLAVDHDHKTGRVRGLLCSFCNTGLGFFKDDILLLERAIKYLLDKING